MGECLKLKKKIQMHIAQRKELDVHKTKQKRDKNRTTTSLVLDSSMQSGRWEFRQNQRIWLRLSSVFESRRISFFKIFLVCSTNVLAKVKRFVLEKFQKILKVFPRSVLEQIKFVLEQFQNKSLELLWNNCRTPLIKCPI